MIAQRATPGKRIVITAADFDRLHGLVESPRYRTTHADLLHTLKEELDRGEVVRPDRRAEERRHNALDDAHLRSGR